MAKQKRYWCLGYAPYTPILRGLIFETKAEAARRAREENRHGEYRGLGIKAYPCDENGNMLRR